ncbi:rCG27132 [Rattus norvegicus]|uniref:RCG27132 n=1 Tax=Rattus norvegicus TaxID=10116 RepID=A6HM48_RAT|nr:rCG27132 [Rattus norvegicus]
MGQALFILVASCDTPRLILYSRLRLWMQTRKHAFQEPLRAQQLQPGESPV